MTLTLTAGQAGGLSCIAGLTPESDEKEANMADPTIQTFVPPEMRALAEQSFQQARKAFDDLMAATQRAVSTFEGQASTAQTSVLEMQRKVASFAERNIATSFEFAQKLLRAKSPEDVMKLHAEYVTAQTQALTEQAREIAQYAAKAAAPQSR
jgi:phasin